MADNTYTINQNSFQRTKAVEKQVSADYERGLLKNILRTLTENKLAMFCAVMLFLIVLVSLLAPLSPHDPDAQDFLNKLQPPSAEHWFGTDELGRDYFTRALYGGRISLSVGFLSMLLSTVIGTLIGTTSGYMGGKVDMFLMRFTDIFMSVPSFLLMVVINSLFPPKVYSMVIILGLFEWCQIARITRAETLSLKERDFVLASKHLGVSNIQIMFQHIIPNMSSSIIVAGSLAVARAILTESALSFMGLGVQLPKASWGTMLQGAQVYIMDMPSLAVFPGLFIVMTVFSFNILGDALRNALEPRTLK
ncbi:MAG: ABC transporter permease [Eubacteriales bacterium]|nr:ABC transporter permease [Eubacteriales bacterium]